MKDTNKLYYGKYRITVFLDLDPYKRLKVGTSPLLHRWWPFSFWSVSINFVKMLKITAEVPLRFFFFVKLLFTFKHNYSAVTGPFIKQKLSPSWTTTCSQCCFVNDKTMKAEVSQFSFVCKVSKHLTLLKWIVGYTAGSRGWITNWARWAHVFGWFTVWQLVWFVVISFCLGTWVICTPYVYLSCFISWFWSIILQIITVSKI